jgi:hypothetical protein
LLQYPPARHMQRLRSPGSRQTTQRYGAILD